ncbi:MULTISPECIES: 5-carboxymethyl-2-hydroxymuconate Delta-isomerase [unclassified Achromobacter]|jgi:5-carboxymethyl-2-hydroxymuconate isomerase|uniref:5-carboxymethyl-2-hydroxymuconate Delta-isomerase n=1 Tax=unclassified Achromobacter TaxID=2626865 RepID=UPI00069F5C4A|nr:MULTISPECIES: 5-carboxymethyl-2-hydroxymuconate Delta-isomerase [unclassified Achromobacter]KOF52345.1 5-carboxymethyl-2-hydroxymuconate isomerase [Achromobacter sp. DMS1]
MPHVVILYTGNLDARADMGGLCRKLADAMLAVRAEDGSQVFPTGGTRVYAYPAPHYAVADGGAAGKAAGGDGDYGFVYVNLRMGRGRSDAVRQAAGDALLACAREHLAPVFAAGHLGLTVQVDESPGQVYDGKHSTLHPLFSR